VATPVGEAPIRAEKVPGRATGEAALVRAVGTWGLAAGIVNVTVGGGIFRLPAGAAQQLGAAAPIAYLVCAVAMALIVMCFAEAGSRVSLTGGLYAYVETAFGSFIGFITGVLLWLGLVAAFAGVSIFLGDAVAALVPALDSRAARTGVVALVLAVLAALNVAGVRQASAVNTVVTVAKLLPLLLVVALGIAAVQGSNLAFQSAPSAPSVARGAAFVIFAFLGIEAALVPSGEVRDPARTVPRAIAIAMTTVTVLYLAVHLVVQGILGPALPGSATPVADAAGVGIGPWARTLILAGSALSMLGYLSGMTLAVPRMLFAFARDGFLPATLARVHPRFRTPHVAIVVQVLIVLVVALTGSFEQIVLVANGAVLLAYAACAAAAWRLRQLDVRGGEVPFRVPGGAIVPVLAFAVIVWMMTGLSAREWVAIGIVLVVAVLLYAATLGARRRAAERAAAGVVA
jgi:basic amino acid/polyamine antiporter, APA family